MNGCKLSLLVVTLASFSLTGCGDDAPLANAERPDAETTDPVCEPKPLSAFCTEATACPLTDTAALLDLCPMNMERTFTQASSCGGRSIIDASGPGETIYHFDDDDRLVGVHQATDLVLACSDEPNAPSSSERFYGRVCSLSGERSGACSASCPLIACRAGASLLARWPFTFEQAIGLPITACRNDECFTGMLGPALLPEPSSGVGFTVPEADRDRDQTGLASVWFHGQEGGFVYLELEWIPWSDADLKDGDRYRLTTELAGETHVLIDYVADYALHEIGTGACRQTCHFADIDLRDAQPDGGVSDDDAGR